MIKIHVKGNIRQTVCTSAGRQILGRDFPGISPIMTQYAMNYDVTL